MNGNDLLNALNGLDPKYIEEAAFELHDKPLHNKNAKITHFRKTLFVALPAAAAVLITVSVLYSGVVRHNKNESAATGSVPLYESEEAADASASDYYEEEAADDSASDSYKEVPENAPDSDYYEEESEDIPASNYRGEEAAAASESTYEGEAAESFMPADDNKDALGETAGTTAGFRCGKASYDKGILTIEVTGTLPSDIKDISYVITGKDDTGSEKTYSEGILGDIFEGSTPFTLDISGLKLSDGTYTLSIAEQNIEFVVK